MEGDGEEGGEEDSVGGFCLAANASVSDRKRPAVAGLFSSSLAAPRFTQGGLRKVCLQFSFRSF